jgi:hypothetical protein
MHMACGDDAADDDDDDIADDDDDADDVSSLFVPPNICQVYTHALAHILTLYCESKKCAIECERVSERVSQ